MAEPILLTLAWDRGAKTWVAEISGTSKKYGLERDFVAACERDRAKQEAVYLLGNDTLYEVCELDERRFVHTAGGEIKEVSKVEALGIVAAMEQKGKEGLERIDSAIAQFNSEGGFSLN